MTPSQRQAAFNRLLVSLAKKRARRLGLAYAGTIRKLPPPPLPGEKQGETRYYLNAAAGGAGAGGLVELSRASNAQLRRAERWAETGKGGKPPI